ncbi:MAG: methyltransferase [Bergeyella sp.]
MKPFNFQKFTVQQSERVFRVGTDGVLIGALASVEGFRNILEVGCGTGLISLMLAQRNPDAEFFAVDISREAAELASQNFLHSPFSERLKAGQHDYKSLQTDKRFDLIISNPPYFEENASLKDVLARQKTELNFEQLVGKSSELITESGLFTVIIPSDFSSEFENIAKKYGFFLCRKVNIYGIESGSLKRVLLEFSKTEKPFTESDFIIEKSPRQYSDQYLELTKEFHVFKK